MAARPQAVVPNSVIPSHRYRLGLKWWLGVPIINTDDEEETLCPGCGIAVDRFGDHVLSCPRNNFAARHNGVQTALAAILAESNQPHALEVPVPECNDAALRPADLLLKNWFGGQDTAVDLTVCHGWQQSEQNLGREKWRAFLRRKEQAKHTKYDQVCRNANWRFTAMSFGTWGGLGPEAGNMLSRIIKKAAAWQDGDIKASLQEDLRHTVGLCLMSHIWDLLEAKNWF